MMLCLLLLLKSFQLETKIINIQQDTLTITDHIPVEQARLLGDFLATVTPPK